MSIKLIFRYPSKQFKSIENVFETLLPYLDCTKFILENPSKGVINRIKNWISIRSLRSAVIHVTGFDHYLLLLVSRNKKMILTIHDIEALKRMKGVKRYIFKKLWFDFPIRNAAAVTTISQFTKDELLELYPYKTPIFVISNPTMFKIKESNRVAVNEIQKVLLIGTKSNKNLKRIFKALDSLKCEIHLVGELQPKQVQEYEIQNLNIVNHKNINKKSLENLYERSTLLCFVSTYEGFGLPIIEAQSLGCPVVTSNCSSMPEVAGKGALFVDPFSELSIKDGVAKVLNDGKLRKELIQKGFENAKRFQPEIIAEKYISLYKRVQNE